MIDWLNHKTPYIYIYIYIYIYKYNRKKKKLFNTNFDSKGKLKENTIKIQKTQ